MNCHTCDFCKNGLCLRMSNDLVGEIAVDCLLKGIHFILRDILSELKLLNEPEEPDDKTPEIPS